MGLVGPQVSILPQESLAAGPQLDFVARREFDYTVTEVAQGRPWDEILGLSYRQTAASITTPTGPTSRTWTPCPLSRRFTTGT